MITAPLQHQTGGGNYTHQFGNTRDVQMLHQHGVGNRRKTISPRILASGPDIVKDHVGVPQDPQTTISRLPETLRSKMVKYR